MNPDDGAVPQEASDSLNAGPPLSNFDDDLAIVRQAEEVVQGVVSPQRPSHDVANEQAAEMRPGITPHCEDEVTVTSARCESCLDFATVRLSDGSTWCEACHDAALLLHYDDDLGTAIEDEGTGMSIPIIDRDGWQVAASWALDQQGGRCFDCDRLIDVENERIQLYEKPGEWIDAWCVLCSEQLAIDAEAQGPCEDVECIGFWEDKL
jgi:hypothetical protein